MSAHFLVIGNRYLWTCSDTQTQAQTLSATHCNKLQHTATQCSPMQHTAAHCNTLQDTAINYSDTPKWQAGSALYHLPTNPSPPHNAHTATHCNTLQHTDILQHTAPYCNTLHHATNNLSSTHLLSRINMRTHQQREPQWNEQHTVTQCNTLQDTATHCNIGTRQQREAL